MKTELSKQITTRFPKIFEYEDYPLSIGDGWFELFKNLCDEIQLVCDLTGLQVTSSQVKEKFGSLRFYINIENNAFKNGIDYALATNIIYALISNAERSSENICECCGEYGKIQKKSSGWLVAICKKCLE